MVRRTQASGDCVESSRLRACCACGRSWHRVLGLLSFISEGVCEVSVNENLITKILLLLPTHPTLEALLECDDLTNVRAADIYAAVRILEQRKLVRMSELFGRGAPE